MQHVSALSLVDSHVHLGQRPRHDSKNRVKIDVQRLNYWYGKKQALFDVDLSIASHEVTAFIGPSGCGKTTLLRCLNRSNDEVPGGRMTGIVLMDGKNIYDPAFDPPVIRRRFGWVAQKPNPFPRSVYENISYAPRLHGTVKNVAETDALVEASLRRASLWDEVKDRLHESGMELSGGQQQRLCVARAIAYEAEVILMDEPASALDPIATAKLEELIDQLRAHYTIVIITHNMQEAARMAQRVAMFHLGNIVEDGNAEDIFIRPQKKITQDYLTGRFG